MEKSGNGVHWAATATAPHIRWDLRDFHRQGFRSQSMIRASRPVPAAASPYLRRNRSVAGQGGFPTRERNQLTEEPRDGPVFISMPPPTSARRQLLVSSIPALVHA
jgi:hypothetical protein